MDVAEDRTGAEEDPRKTTAAIAVAATTDPTTALRHQWALVVRRTCVGVSLASASANSSAVANRSAGTLASARWIAASIGAGTVARTVWSECGGSTAWRARMA